MTRFVQSTFYVVVLACLTAAPAEGQDAPRRRAPPVAVDEEARRLFFVGAQLFQEGDYEGALSSWESSYDLQPQPVVKYNRALALRELFRYAEAVALLREYLAEAQTLAPQRRSEIARAVEVLDARIAPITLVIEPAGARVRIDGRSVGSAPIPQPLQLSAGRRRIEVEADGFLPISDEISVAGRRPRTIQIRLARRNEAGTLRIASALPQGAELRIDGLEVGRAPVARELPRGGHVVEARAPGHAPYRTSVELATNQALDLRVVLDPEHQTTVAEEWWFWTVIGAVVLGGVITTAVLAQPQEGQPVAGDSFTRVIEVLLER